MAGPHTRVASTSANSNSVSRAPAVDENGRPLLFNPDAAAFARAAHDEMSSSRSRSGGARGRMTAAPRTVPPPPSTMSARGVRPTPSSSSLGSTRSTFTTAPRATPSPAATAARPSQTENAAPPTPPAFTSSVALSSSSARVPTGPAAGTTMGGIQGDVAAFKAAIKARQEARDRENAADTAELQRYEAETRERERLEAERRLEQEKQAAEFARFLKKQEEAEKAAAEERATKKKQEDEAAAAAAAAAREQAAKKKHEEEAAVLREKVLKREQAKRKEEAEEEERRQASIREKAAALRKLEEEQATERMAVAREEAEEKARLQRENLAADGKALQQSVLEVTGELIRQMSRSPAGGRCDSPVEGTLTVERELRLSGATAQIVASPTTSPVLPVRSMEEQTVREQTTNASQDDRNPAMQTIAELMRARKKLEDALAKVNRAIDAHWEKELAY